MTHLIVDVENLPAAAERVLTDEVVIGRLFDLICEKVGLRAVSPTTHVRFPATKVGPAGLTSFVVLSQSHISYHSYAEYRGFGLDVYSCRPFDEVIVKRVIANAFGRGDYFWQVVERTGSSPLDGPSSMTVVSNDDQGA